MRLSFRFDNDNFRRVKQRTNNRHHYGLTRASVLVRNPKIRATRCFLATLAGKSVRLVPA